MKEGIIKTINYKNFEITLVCLVSIRYGRLFRAYNNIGEPYLDNDSYRLDSKYVIDQEKNNIDSYLQENY